MRATTGRRVASPHPHPYTDPMTVEQLREALTAAPFKPFRIHMANNRTFVIPHPDFMSIGPRGRTFVVHSQDGNVSHVLDTVLAAELESMPDAAAGRPAETADAS